MKNILLSLVVVFIFAVVPLNKANADGHELPMIGGVYWEVTGISLADGAGLKYMKHLAAEWKKNMDFAASKGWIEGYKVLSNVHARADEPDLYLIVMFENMATVAENEERRKAYIEFAKKSMDTLASESGDRAEYRTIMSTSLLQEMKFR